MTITTFGHKNLQAITEDINTALKGIGTKYGISISSGRVSYSPNDFRTKITAIIPDAKVNGQDPYHVVLFNGLKESGFFYGLKEADYKKVVTLYGTEYMFMGIKPSGRRTPLIMMKLSNKKLFRFDTSIVKDIKAGKK